MLYTYSTSASQTRIHSAMAAQTGPVTALFVSFLPGLPMLCKSLAVSCVIIIYISSCLLDWSLVFLVDYLLTVFLLSPILLSHTPAMICLSTEYASNTFNIRSGLGLAILSTLFLRMLRTYIYVPLALCLGTPVPRQKDDFPLITWCATRKHDIISSLGMTMH